MPVSDIALVRADGAVRRPAFLPALASVAAAAAWIGLSALVALPPDLGDFGFTRELAIGFAGFGALLLAAGFLHPGEAGLVRRIQGWSPWLVVLAGLLGLWELATAKRAWLPMPFFPPPQAILEVFVEDYARLADSVWHSLRLLAGGYALGALAGFTLGVAIGWSRNVGYWVHPVLRFVGPLPATAWLPLAFF
ncbi:ABC transporter permease, partial [Methylobacterium frigidaeris]